MVALGAMGDELRTRLSLLARLGDASDRAAWQQFVEVYGSLVYTFARRRGLQDADAADLTQDVFFSIAQSAGHWRYNAAEGSFRGWLYGIARNKIASLIRKQLSQPLATGEDGDPERRGQEPRSESELEALWEEEYRQHLFRLAVSQVQPSFTPKTWQAFWQTAVEGKGGAAVAGELGMSVGAVYVARSRVLARLTDQIQLLQQE